MKLAFPLLSCVLANNRIARDSESDLQAFCDTYVSPTSEMTVKQAEEIRAQFAECLTLWGGVYKSFGEPLELEPYDIVSATYRSGQFTNVNQNLIDFSTGPNINGFDTRVICARGYELVEDTPYSWCRDIDECVEFSFDPCTEESFCNNLPGDYECICPSGYIDVGSYYEGYQCENIDECSEQIDTCNENFSSCRDTTGFYECDCLPGFIKNSQGVCGDGSDIVVVDSRTSSVLEMIKLKLEYENYPGLNLNTGRMERAKRMVIDAEELVYEIPFYGCNCAATDPDQGSEAPFFYGYVDSFDSNCKHRRVCQTCVKNDCLEGDFEWTVHFDTITGLFDCQGINVECGKMKCECEVDFAEKAVRLIMSDDFNYEDAIVNMDMDVCHDYEHRAGNPGHGCQKREWFPEELKE